MTTANKSSFASELKRRKVPRSLLAYIVICWAVIQIGEVLLPVLGVEPEGPLRILLFLAIAGTPVCIAIAWFFQITKSGIVRTQSFEERRVLNNISPINERRKEKVGQYFGGQSAPEDYPWLILFDNGPLEGLTYGVSETVVLGRALECDITILTNLVSRQHARLKVDNTRLMVEDLGSANGTQVNGKLIEGITEVTHDDEISLQDVSFRVSQSYSRSSTESSAMNQTMVVKPGEEQA
ncbi:MAG: FHA domain-containing protein [Pseudomonadota bacterium]